MKSEERHELQKNELADGLSRLNSSIDPYSKQIAVGVALLFAGLIGWTVYSSSQSDTRSDATLQLLEGSSGGNSETLAEISTKYPGTSAASWSQLYLGSDKLAQGINGLFNNRGEAETLLEESEAAFEEAIRLGKDPILLSRAHFGLARVHESLGNVDSAIKSYEAAMGAGESEAMEVEAKRRIELLSSPQAKEFLVWFKEQDFSPAEPAMPPSLPGANALPDLPDLELPGLDLPTSEEAAGTTGSEPDMESPAEKTSAEEKPAKPEAPAETKVSGMTVKDEPQPAKEEPAKEEPATSDGSDKESQESVPAEKTETELEPAKKQVDAPEPAVESPAPADAD